MFQIENYMQKYVLDNDTYEKVSKILLQEMEKGLHKETNADAKVKMFPTYVRHLPDGSGAYLINWNYKCLSLYKYNVHAL